MTCKELIDFLDRFEAGDLEPGTQDRFRQHLDDCPPCMEYLDSYRATIAIGRKACCDDRDLPEGMPEGLVAAILKAVVGDR